MAAAWVKSLQCKTRAFDDVIHHPTPRQPLIPSSSSSGNTAAASCRNSFQGLKDVVPKSQQPAANNNNNKSNKSGGGVHPKLNPKPKHKPKPEPPPPLPPLNLKEVKRRQKSDPQVSRRRQDSSSSSVLKQSIRPAVLHHLPDPFFPSLSELQEGHPSRNVVEIIFHTRWGPKPFPGKVEMVFKIHSLSKTVSRFEDYRETVKARAGSDNDDKDNGGGGSEDSLVRCVADGNEMMRFHCLGPTTGVIDAGAGGICTINAASGAAKVGVINSNNNIDKSSPTTTTSICTFDGSGTAHDSAGGGKGMRAMLVCRVIAGRIKRRKVVGTAVPVTTTAGGFESVAGENGDLIVFDSRAVLPCFLVIYRL